MSNTSELDDDEQAILDLPPKVGCGSGSCGSTKFSIPDRLFRPPNRDVPDHDLVNHPPHYNNHPEGIECVDVVKHMLFLPGNAIKYIWRADLKGDPIENYEKAIACLKMEIERRKKIK